MMFTVMVKWHDSQRAERLGDGTTTGRRIHATMFKTREDAQSAAQMALTDLPKESAANLERWWIARF